MNQMGTPPPPQRASPIRRDILFDEAMPMNTSLVLLDLDRLRRTFAALGDRAAQVVTAAGFDQDDVVLDRLIACRVNDTVQAEVPADWLADAARLSDAIIAALSAQVSRPVSAETVTIAAVRVRAVREHWA